MRWADLAHVCGLLWCASPPNLVEDCVADGPVAVDVQIAMGNWTGHVTVHTVDSGIDENVMHYSCVLGVASSPAPPLHTGCINVDGSGTRDWRGVSCANGRVLSMFRPVPGECNLQFEYQCADLEPNVVIGALAVVSTTCKTVIGSYLSQLESHAVNCGTGRLLTSFEITREGCEESMQRVRFECAVLAACPSVRGGSCTRCSYAATCEAVSCDAHHFDHNADASDGCEATCVGGLGPLSYNATANVADRTSNDGTSNALFGDGPGWLTPAEQRQDAYVTFTLPTSSIVASFIVTNSGNTSYAVRHIDVFFSQQGYSFELATTSELPLSGAADAVEAIVTVPSRVPAARYWRIQLRTFWRTSPVAGLADVKIVGCRSSEVEATASWIGAGERQSCSEACDARDAHCSERQMLANNTDVDSAEKLEAKIAVYDGEQFAQMAHSSVVQRESCVVKSRVGTSRLCVQHCSFSPLFAILKIVSPTVSGGSSIASHPPLPPAFVNHPTAITCTTPSTPGYNFTNMVETTLSRKGFAVSGVVCANDFVGTVTYSACTRNGPYAVSGCVGEGPCMPC